LGTRGDRRGGGGGLRPARRADPLGAGDGGCRGGDGAALAGGDAARRPGERGRGIRGGRGGRGGRRGGGRPRRHRGPRGRAGWALAAPGLWRARREPVVRAAVPGAVAVWLLVSAAATGTGLAVLDALVDAVPAAGLVRDTQKFVALALPATVLALAVATRALARWLRPAGAAVLVAAVAVASVPDAPAALWSALRPVTYGPGWAEVDR